MHPTTAQHLAESRMQELAAAASHSRRAVAEPETSWLTRNPLHHLVAPFRRRAADAAAA
jgi:hypothetical protein